MSDNYSHKAPLVSKKLLLLLLDLISVCNQQIALTLSIPTRQELFLE